jgi:hypothetical protein
VLGIIAFPNFSGAAPRPGISITFPAKGARVTTNQIIVRGTTPANSGVTNVWVWVGASNGAVTATTTNTWRNWEAPVTLEPGPNWIQAQSFDGAGQSSLIVSQSVSFVVLSPLTLWTNLTDGTGTPLYNLTAGNCSIQRSFNTNWLEVGQSYKVTAMPGVVINVTVDPSVGIGQSFRIVNPPVPGVAFSNWTDGAGQVLSTHATYRFTMTSNLTLQANFVVTNQVQASQGTYHGLFFPTNSVSSVAVSNSGSVRIALNANGSLSGKVVQRGVAYAFTGSLNASKQASVKVQGPNQTVWRMHLSLDPDATISGSIGTAGWESPLSAVRLAVLGGDYWFGHYTLLILPTNSAAVSPPLDDPNAPTNSPAGYGAGTVTSGLNNAITLNAVVDPNGNVTQTTKFSPQETLHLGGTLADGNKVSQNSGFSDGGWWPVYVSLYGGRGLLMGWLNVVSNDPARSLLWLKPTNSTKYYPAGFNVLRPVILNQFSPVLSPVSAETALNWTNGILVAGGGNLPDALTNPVVATGTKFASQNGAVVTNQIQLRAPLTNVIVATTNGGFVTNTVRAGPLTNLAVTVDLLRQTLSGSFLHPATGKKVTFKGGMINSPTYVEIDSAWGGGWFLGTNQSGFVRLEPDFVPHSITGLTAHLSIPANPAWAVIGFDATTFAQTGADSGAGGYLYAKLTTTTAQLLLNWSAPPDLSNRMDQFQFTFASHFDGSFAFMGVNPDGSRSEVSGTFWLESPGDPAPTSLEGKAIAATIPGRSPVTAVFGADTFTQTGPAEQSYAVGQYTYEKQSPSLARLITMATDPPNAAGDRNEIDLQFTSATMGFYTNYAGVGGFSNVLSTRFTLSSQTNLAPASIAGQTVLIKVSGQGSATITLDSTTFTQTGLDAGSGDYTYEVLSPNGALLVLTTTAPPAGAGNKSYIMLRFTTSVSGTFGNSFQPASGDPEFQTGTFEVR